MAIEKKDVDQIAEELGARFTEFKCTNDATLNGIKSEQSKLNDTLEGLNEKLTQLDSLKSGLEEELLSIKRPGGGANSKDVEAYKSEFLNNFMRKGKEDNLQALGLKAINTGVDADGGFAVPEELDRALIELAHDMVVMRQECNVMTVGTPDYKKLVNLGGAQSGWVGETAARPETGTPTLKELVAVFGEIYANPQATQRSLDDMFFNVESWLNSEVSQEFSDQEESAFTNGDGSNKPKGLWTYPTATTADASRAFGTLQHFVTGTVGAVSGDDLLQLIYGLRKPYRANAKFMMNNNSLFAVRKLKDSNGDYLWQPGLQLGQPSTVLGYGIAENEQVAEIAADALPIAFGDFKKTYTILDRIGTRILRDPYTNKPYVGFYTTKRVGSMMTNSQSLKFLKVKKS